MVAKLRHFYFCAKSAKIKFVKFSQTMVRGSVFVEILHVTPSISRTQGKLGSLVIQVT